MNCCCENCGWSEIVGSPIICNIMCNYNGYLTWYDECCEAWKPKEKETNMVEVVRCKDCIHWDKGHTEECENSDSICFHNGWCKPDWFCADGERRMNDA